MPLGVAQELSATDKAEIEALIAQDMEEAGEPLADPGDESSKTAQEELPAKSTDDTAKTVQDEKPKGDTRAALRAARREAHKFREGFQTERAAKEEALAELAEMRKANREIQTGDDLTDEEIQAAETDFPLVGKIARKNKALEAELAALRQNADSSSKKQTAEATFEPMYLPPDLQDAVDDIPQLAEWHENPDQTAWEMAIKEEEKLLLLKKWKDATPAQRLVEVTRRVQNDLADERAPTSKNTVNAADAIAQAKQVKPRSLADIGGGGETPNSASNLSRFAQMSDEDITNELLLGDA